MALICTISGNPNPWAKEKMTSLPLGFAKKSLYPAKIGPRTSSFFYRARSARPDCPPIEVRFPTNDIMYLETDGTLDKQSYVLTKHVFALPLSKLQTFNLAFSNRLAAKSYTILMDRVHLRPALWMETSLLKSGRQDPSAFAAKSDYVRPDPEKRAATTLALVDAPIPSFCPWDNDFPK